MDMREYAILSVMAGMPDASISEITRYAYAKFNGMSHEQAREYAIERRNPVFANKESRNERVVAWLPEDIVKEAHARIDVDMNASTMHRYILASVTTDDENQALALATRKPGRPRKKRREQGLAALKGIMKGTRKMDTQT
jgi:hypothetical protein